MALIRAVCTEFPHAKRSGCNFHHTQAIIRKVKKLGLISAYRDKVSTQLCVRKLLALGFLPPNCIVPAFERLSMFSQTKLRQLFEYY